MNKLIRLKNVQHYICKWIENQEIVFSKDSIDSILPWDGANLGGDNLLRIKNYKGLIESYVISREQYNHIVKEFNL